jgi:hypothetical protein
VEALAQKKVTALIAYLQRLGKDLTASTEAVAPIAGASVETH